MLPIAIDGVQCTVVCASVCVSVGHVHETGKNGRSDRDADWRVVSGGPKEAHIRRVKIPIGRGNFGGCLD